MNDVESVVEEKTVDSAEWKETRISEVINLIGGGTPKTQVAEYWNGDIPWLSVADFNTGKKYVFDAEKKITQKGLKNSSTRLLGQGDIIISARGTVGVVAVLGRPMAFNQSCYGVKANEKSTSDFIYYLLKDSVFNFLQHSHGGVFNTITRDTFKEIEILLPPLPEQRAIASVLSSLDEKIDLLHRQNETLEKMAETLFRQWFLPAGRQGVEEADKQMELGVISDLIDFNPSRKISKGQSAPYLEMAELSTSTYAPSSWYFREFSSGSRFKNGDALLARITPCLENGKAAYIDFLEEEEIGWGSTEFIVMRTRPNLHPFFSYVVTRNDDFKDFAESCMQGSSGRQRVDIDNLKSYEIAIPSPNVIEGFNNFCHSIVPKLKSNQDQIRTLTALRDALLPKLMSGEVRVEMDTIVENG